MQFRPVGRALQVGSAFRRTKVFLLKAVAGAQRPEEAYICIQEARKFGAECSLSKYRVITSSGAFGYIADELKKLCVIMLDKLENETATQIDI